MPVINNQEDWWFHFNEHLDNITDIVITYAVPVGQIQEAADKLKDYAEKQEWDFNLDKLLQDAWYYAPEHGCRDLPSWFVLCDLCSEHWVFTDEMTEEELLEALKDEE